MLITGAGRGLGLGFTIQCLSHGCYVFAGVRNIQKATALQELSEKYPENLKLVALDVTNSQSIDNSYNIVFAQANGLDLLINNAGVNSKSDGMGGRANHVHLGQLHARKMLDLFHVNAIAPIILAQRYIDLLKTGTNSKIINISSEQASISNKVADGNYSYCASKTALNMLTRTLAFEVIQFDIIAVTIHPGSVKTDMNPHGSLTPTESAEAILQTASSLKKEDAGNFFDYKGRAISW